MRRFDVYRNDDRASARHIPYLLVLQSELLLELPTRVVAPLVLPRELTGPPARQLNPEFDVEGRRVVMLTQQLAGVAIQRLKARVGTLEEHHHTILRALDFLFSGI